MDLSQVNIDLSHINQEYLSKLQSCTNDNIQEFGFYNNETKLVKVIDVYDGDTITIALCIDKTDCNARSIYKFKVRMYGYNTEEIRQPKNEPNREEKKQWAIYQRDWVIERILNKIVLLECLGYDKYGRILGKVYLDNNKTQCLNDIIVQKNIATKYVL